VAIEREAKHAVLAPATTAALARMVRCIYPHDRFRDGPYERVSEALDESAAADAVLAGALEQGVRDLDAATGTPFTQLSDAEARAVVEGLSETPFFQTVRAAAVVALYDQAEVWEVLGYEGPSYDKGGYLERGFDDLDWLPDVPV
jgi:hypothetical protein